MVRSWCVVLLMLCAGTSALLAAEPKKVETAPAVDLFQAIKDGQIEAKLIPTNDKEAHLLVTNKTKEPVTIKLPEGFAGVPILAQAVVGGALPLAAARAGQAQPVGVGGGGLGGGAAFNIAPEKVKNIKLECLCLKHGAPDPNPSILYEIEPMDQYSSDTTLQELVKLFSHGDIDHQAAQAAAWHVANNMTWEELANKQLKHIGRPGEPYFSVAQINAARKTTAQAEQLAKQRPAKNSSESLSLNN